jgi:hypothetical protein
MRTTAEHERFRLALCDFLKGPGGAANLSGAEVLALAAYMVGGLIALQDHRVMSGARAMAIVNENMMLGNKSMVGDLMRQGGGLQ